MAQFSRKERLIASILSATPGLKAFIKKVYVRLNYVIHRKGYRLLVLNLSREVRIIEPHIENNETVFGYYDKSPENSDGWILFNETECVTSKEPCITHPIWLNIINRHGGTPLSVAPLSVADSFSYNWQ